MFEGALIVSGYHLFLLSALLPLLTWVTQRPPVQKAPKGPSPGIQCATFLAASGIIAPLATRKAALARFRAKKARSHFAPKVRYYERKKLAEARPRYKGQFIKISALSKQMQNAHASAVDVQGSAAGQSDLARKSSDMELLSGRP